MIFPKALCVCAQLFPKALCVCVQFLLIFRKALCVCVQFLLIFRKAAAGELEEGSGLLDLYANVTEIDVDKEGVKGAKNFFQAKVLLLISAILFHPQVVFCPDITNSVDWAFKSNSLLTG